MRAARSKALRTRDTLERRFPVVTALAERLLAANVVDEAFRLAAQTFLTAMPLLFTFAAFAPPAVRDQALSSIRTVFGIDDAAAVQMRQLLDASSGTLRETAGALSAIMALLSATSFSRALARICERAWQLPKSSTRVGAWRWLLWIVVWVALVVAQGPLRNGFGSGPWLGALVSLVVGSLQWWWTQHLLLAGRVHWLPLLPAAVLTSLATTVVSLTAHVYMPIALNKGLSEYGPLGGVFTILSWLVVICVAVCLTLTAGAILGDSAHRGGSPGPDGAGHQETGNAEGARRQPATNKPARRRHRDG